MAFSIILYIVQHRVPLAFLQLGQAFDTCKQGPERKQLLHACRVDDLDTGAWSLTLLDCQLEGPKRPHTRKHPTNDDF